MARIHKSTLVQHPRGLWQVDRKPPPFPLPRSKTVDPSDSDSGQLPSFFLGPQWMAPCMLVGTS
jgi:hypothetical protein